MTRESAQSVEMVTQFRQLGSHISAGGQPTESLERLVLLAKHFVPGTDSVAVTQAGRNPRTLAATDQVARTVDLLQMEANEGPCLDAAENHTAIETLDLKKEKRWPNFVDRAITETPVRAILTFELSEENPVSAINLYANEPYAFTPESVINASLFAAHAQLAVMHMHATAKQANLEQALVTSRQIGMALGVLMSERKITAEQAFELLRASSQQLQRKLRDIAHEVTETGTLP